MKRIALKEIRLRFFNFVKALCQLCTGNIPYCLPLPPIPTSNSFQKLSCLKSLSYYFTTKEHKDLFLYRLPSARIMYHGWKKSNLFFISRENVVYVCAVNLEWTLLCQAIFWHTAELVFNATFYFANIFKFGIIGVFFFNEITYI